MGLGRFGGFLATVCVSVATATAGTFSFTGSILTDDQLELFQFTAPSASTVVRTWGYAGGTNAAGTLVPGGGFDPILSVFDATGGLVSTSLRCGKHNGKRRLPHEFAELRFAGCYHRQRLGLLYCCYRVNVGGIYVLVLSQSDNSANGPTYGNGF